MEQNRSQQKNYSGFIEKNIKRGCSIENWLFEKNYGCKSLVLLLLQFNSSDIKLEGQSFLGNI